jgi:putative Ca2+/H+ antiporter (TMEM165/GDT1 family)
VGDGHETVLAAFVTVFLAEPGDKTHLATLLFATTPASASSGSSSPEVLLQGLRLS